jgi:hypothetical protein
MRKMAYRRTVKLSRRLKGTSLWSGMASDMKLLSKMAAIQPVGWSAMFGGIRRCRRFSLKTPDLNLSHNNCKTLE